MTDGARTIIAEIINEKDTTRAAVVRDVSEPAIWHYWAADAILEALAVAAPTIDARTIIATASVCHRTQNPISRPPRQNELNEADAVLAALRDNGLEVCAVAAPTITPNDLTDDDYRNIEWCLREWATVEAQVAELARNGYELHRVAAPTITPQPNEQQVEAAARVVCPYSWDYATKNSREHARTLARRALVAAHGVGGSITPSDEITITPAMQKLNTLLGGWPGGGSTTPADQEDTDACKTCGWVHSEGQDCTQASTRQAADQEDTDDR